MADKYICDHAKECKECGYPGDCDGKDPHVNVGHCSLEWYWCERARLSVRCIPVSPRLETMHECETCGKPTGARCPCGCG